MTRTLFSSAIDTLLQKTLLCTKIEIIKLNGSVELAPIVGLSDVIVDIVETGNTLKANGLEILEDICNISARIISNRASYRFKYEQIQNIIRLFEELDN